jgi:hypothetical protein
MDIDYKQKILKYKQKYLNLKNNTMKGGVRMEIVVTKNADGTINIQLPPNFSSATPGTYKFEHDTESVREEKGPVRAPDLMASTPFVMATGGIYQFLAMEAFRVFEAAHEAYKRNFVQSYPGESPHRMELDLEMKKQNPALFMRIEDVDPNLRMVFEHMKKEMDRHNNFSSVVVESEDSVSFLFGPKQKIIVKLTTLH